MEQTLPLPIAIVLYAFGGVSLTVGLGVVWRVARGEAIVPHEPRRPVPWRSAHIVLVLLYLLVPLVLEQAEKLRVLLSGGGSAADPYPASELVWVLMFASAMGLMVVGATTAVCWMLAGASLTDLGWRSDTILADVRLGVVAFVALAAPLYLLQWWLTRQFPSEHPVIELLSSRRDPGILVLCGISTVIVAPITEELMFRLFLQGWLEAVAVTPRVPSRTSGTLDPVECADQSAKAPSPPPDVPATCQRTSILALPILASSFLFAALHQWPDQVPLFVLALALGYLYQRTHRILPCIVLHACLNLTSLVLFLIGRSL